MAGAEYVPVDWSKLVAIAPIVLDGHPLVEGSRYPEMSHFTGWFFIATDHDRPAVDDLVLQHPEHLIARRPDLVCYLGLPVGWVVQHTPTEWRAMFEPEILADG